MTVLTRKFLYKLLGTRRTQATASRTTFAVATATARPNTLQPTTAAPATPPTASVLNSLTKYLRHHRKPPHTTETPPKTTAQNQLTPLSQYKSAVTLLVSCFHNAKSYLSTFPLTPEPQKKQAWKEPQRLAVAGGVHTKKNRKDVANDNNEEVRKLRKNNCPPQQTHILPSPHQKKLSVK